MLVDFTKRAVLEIEEADAWWADHRPAVPDAIREELFRALELLALQPGGGALARSRLRGVRRVLLPRIGYALYYRIRPRLRRIEVLAFWHMRRGSRPIR